MSEQSEQDRSMAITESEINMLCASVAADIDKQCDFLESEDNESEVLESYFQEKMDVVNGFLLKAIKTEALWYGEDTDMNPLKFNIFKLMTAVDRVKDMRG